jgi:hypothetical protein
MVRTAFCCVFAALCLGSGTMDDACAGSQRMKISVGPDQIRVSYGSQDILTYACTADSFKPYVKELRSPNGRNILLDSPSDHVHHHGLMLAYNADGINFWEENPQCGFQRQQKPIESWSQAQEQFSSAGLSCGINWQSPQGAVVLQEDRSVDVQIGARHQAHLVAWTSCLKGGQAGKAVTLAGDHYFGLGMRFVRAMDKTGRFINATKQPGTVFRGDERLAEGHWCAYLAELDGQALTVAMFDHPENLRPVTWFTMKTPFAYLAATLKLHEESYTLPADQKLVLRYAVAVWDGHTDAQRIEETYRAWLTQQAQGND